MIHAARRSLVALFVVGMLVSAACGDDTPQTTTPDTNTDVRSTETFGATLTVGQSQFYSFTTISPGTTDVTLVSLRPAGSVSSTVSPVVGLGLGIPSGTDCALGWATNTAPALKAQLTVSTSVTTYCVKVADIGNLTGAVDYTIRVLHP